MQSHPARLLLHRGDYFPSRWVTFHRGGSLSIEVDYFYIEVDYFPSRWVTFHRGGSLSIQVDYLLSRWVTFYRGGLFSIDLELYFIIEQLSSWITIMLDNNILVRLVELSLKQSSQVGKGKLYSPSL